MSGGAVDPVGCAYILDPGEVCGAVGQPGSSYCALHHAVCYLARGSRGERSRLRQINALADAVGGRGPGKLTDQFLRQLEARSR